MSSRLLLLYFLLAFGSLKTQTLSTIFIDTVKIVVDNKIIYESYKTKIKFVVNNASCKLTIYNDSIYKLNINFAVFESKKVAYLSFSQSEFHMSDSACFVHSSTANNYEDCSNTIAEVESLRNWDFNNPDAPEKFKINLYYRLCSLAPIDTTNYPYTYRDGLWIGPDRGVEKVTVNYKNDKKHGIATAYYDNGTTYNVNFNNGIADNYGQGYWKNYKSKFKYSLTNIVTRSCDSITAYNHESFYFSQGEKIKDIDKHNTLSLHYEKKGIHHDSIQYNARGEFIELKNDSITIKASEVEIHDFYKNNTDTLHSFLLKTENGYSKIAIKDISKIYYTRENLQILTTLTSFLSFSSALIVAPLISIQKSGFNGDRYKKVALTSLGVMALSISIHIGFSRKEFQLKPSKKSNKIWKIEYDDYE